MSNTFSEGQRWMSESEPELGLGSVLRVGERTVTVLFAASGETREYALDNAPLRRVRFKAGETIQSHDRASVWIDAVSERNGLLFYSGGGREVCETDLSDVIGFSKPEERLLSGHVDPSELFDLRLHALKHRHFRRQSKVRGFVGGRIDLIAHQLYIASEVAERPVPRVLLADEVGLGKTIEACLVLHRLILTNRAERVLILVPESLVHQWFVELLRRFNLWFHIFDEDRCEAIERADPDANPFLDDQLILSATSLLAGNERRAEQALAAGWDILVVDEAHHLGWSPESVSPEYALVEALSRTTPGLLLLTATPEQLGMASHFARLRLLDPDRYFDLTEFIKEAEQYRDVARIAGKLLSEAEFSGTETAVLARILNESEERMLVQLKGDRAVRDELLSALLDRHGTGRVMFRNTRAVIAGFPKRTARMHSIEGTGEEALFEALADEFAVDTGVDPGEWDPEFTSDPRIAWLADLLRGLGSEKVLLICRTRRKAEAVEAALRRMISLKMALFHEGLPLVQRDRNAAWFADDEGARLLLCSEIGSEGRNFQFAHHLVLFDLPLDPELLEQRIGRLDRIGQTAEIQVHVPFIIGSPQDALACWHHQGLNAFEKNLHGGRELVERFGAGIHDLAQDFHETGSTSRAELAKLIEETMAVRSELTSRLEAGRDRLLELNSFRAEAAARLVTAIQQQDKDESLDRFILSVLDHYSVQVEELNHRTYQLGSAGVFADSFPGLPADGLTVTCDRKRALSREDVQFLTWDHPLITGAFDMLLGSEQGNCSFAIWPDRGLAGLYLEAVYLIECIAPPKLHVDRFLPPTPVRVLVDHRGDDAGASEDSEAFAARLRNGGVCRFLDDPEFREDLLPDLLERAHAMANGQVSPIILRARKEMNAQLEREISRLRELRLVNRNVRAEEIELLVQQQRALDEHLSNPRLRLDAIRIIQRGPF